MKTKKAACVWVNKLNTDWNELANLAARGTDPVHDKIYEAALHLRKAYGIMLDVAAKLHEKGE